jgi:hypothetical protein
MRRPSKLRRHAAVRNTRQCSHTDETNSAGRSPRARLADLPALGESSSRGAVPESVVDELRGLTSATVYSERA